MLPHERELLCCRIAAGYVRVRLGAGARPAAYRLRPPGRAERYEAEEVYHDALEDASWEGLWGDDELYDWLVGRGLWDPERQRLLDGVERDIEQLKVGLLDYVFRTQERLQGKAALRAAEAKRHELRAQRHAYDHLTARGTAHLARLRFLVGKGLCLDAGGPALAGDFWSDPSPLVDAAVEAFFETRVAEADYRELARSEPWRTLWATRESGPGLFGAAGADLTEEQRTLLAWSQTYDNVRDHPEAPPAAVLDDDDLTDGWLLKMRRQRDVAEKQKKAEQALGNDKIRAAGEVFIVVDNAADAKDVDDLNGPQARAVKAGRLAYLGKHGAAAEADLPDQRLQIALERGRLGRK